MKKQKFLRGQRVKITDKMPTYMRHFTCGCEAIVEGSYSDLCHSTREEEDDEEKIGYGLLLLTDKPHTSAWYEEDQLTLICSNRDRGEVLLQKYKFK